eukprot:296737_1
MTTYIFFYIITGGIFVVSNFIQCPYSESECVDNVNCGSSAMGRRAGYFCDKWPYYSGGFAECCDENEESYTCTHAVYDSNTNMAFCDFWYMTQMDNELQLCDCKINNGKYCTSWICATISNYDFLNKTKSELFLSKILLPSSIEIFGVHECGYFTDHQLISNNKLIKQWCYKYDDFSSCYCVPDLASAASTSSGYCSNWVCHKYLNNAKNDLSIDDDYYNPNYHNYWNISNTMNMNNNNNKTKNISYTIDVLKLSTKISHEEYTCTDNYNDEHNSIDKSECIKWKGNLKLNNRFSVMECGLERWNSETNSITQHLAPNLTMADLVDAYQYKWQCHEVGMNYRQNKQFINFYLSTIIWSFIIGFIGLFAIFYYMSYKYITLSSFFCVQGWFFFIFGSIAAVHGGFASFIIYFLLQLIILIYIIYLKFKNRGKQPYGSISQRYDFEPADDESVNRDDDNL